MTRIFARLDLAHGIKMSYAASQFVHWGKTKQLAPVKLDFPTASLIPQACLILLPDGAKPLYTPLESWNKPRWCALV